MGEVSVAGKQPSEQEGVEGRQQVEADLQFQQTVTFWYQSCVLTA